MSLGRLGPFRSARSGVEETGAPVPLTYAAMGASDVVGVGADDPVREAWVALIAQRLPPGTRFLRLGVGGALARHALARQLPRAEAARPQLATVWLGVNDFNARVALGSYARHLRRIVVRLARAGARVFVGNLPDLTIVPAFAEVPPTCCAQVWRAGTRGSRRSYTPPAHGWSTSWEPPPAPTPVRSSQPTATTPRPWATACWPTSSGPP